MEGMVYIWLYEKEDLGCIPCGDMTAYGGEFCDQWRTRYDVPEIQTFFKDLIIEL